VDALRRNCVTPTTRQVFGTDYRRKKMVTTFDKIIVGVAVKLLAGVCAGSEDEIINTLTGYLWDEEEAGELKSAKNTEQQVRPDSRNNLQYEIDRLYEGLIIAARGST
jgi:hypothetical protein